MQLIYFTFKIVRDNNNKKVHLIQGKKVGIADTSGQDVVITPSNKFSRFVKIGLPVVLVLVSIYLVYEYTRELHSADRSVSAERLRFAEVTRGDFVRDLSVQGRVIAAVNPKLYSTAQGTITYMVDAGDKVEIGQVLAKIDSPELTNQLKQEQAQLQQFEMDSTRRSIEAKQVALENQKAVDLARVALNAADREKRRADEAFKTKSISQIDFEKAQDELESAKLVFKHAEQDAALNNESLEYEVQTLQLQVQRQRLLVEELGRKVEQLTLLSPVAGIVGNLNVEQKNQVAVNQALLSVVDLSEFALEVSIPESYADDLQIGMDAEVQVSGKTYPATLVAISPEIEQNQVAGRIRFERDQNEKSAAPPGLRQNQRLTTRILLENKSNVLMVQRGQFLQSGSGRIAYKVENNLAHRTGIQTGAKSLASVEVLSGLKEGDVIIVSDTGPFRGAATVYISN